MSLKNVYDAMKSRCDNPNNTIYEYYGGRGIKVCDEWSSSSTLFYDWCLANGYKPGLEINRIDNDGNYEPSNCNFVTHRNNCCNRRSNVFITFNGKTQVAKDWAIELGINYANLIDRIRAGWSPEDAILIPVRKFVGVCFDKSRQKWRASTRDNKHLGRFDTREEAEKAVIEWLMNQSKSV
jgi:hypothetical protein